MFIYKTSNLVAKILIFIFFMEKNIGLNIRNLRELRNYTQTYLAERLGISQRAYSSIENNACNLSIGRIALIASILEVDLNDLVNFDAEKFLSKKSINSEEKEILLKNIKLSEELSKVQTELIETQRQLIEALSKNSKKTK